MSFIPKDNKYDDCYLNVDCDTDEPISLNLDSCMPEGCNL